MAAASAGDLLTLPSSCLITESLMLATELITLPLAERLLAMEALWDSLCREPGAPHATPNWHADVLRQRMSALDSGDVAATPWNEAKIRIRDKAAALTRTQQ
jgi:putative addiction module component (TIGR02574 family)